MENMTSSNTSRLIEIHLDEDTIGHISPDVTHERQVAIYDLLDHNVFEIEGKDAGPYILHLSIVEKRLMFHIRNEAGHVTDLILSLSPFRKLIKDYFLVCESYYEAIKSAPLGQIEAYDMGRRGLHDEASRLLMERLMGKINIDFDSARRLFTLICALHWKG